MPIRVTVVGTGYLGITHAACLAESGCEVLGVDVDVDKVAALAAGEVPLYEPGLTDLVRRHVATGRLRFTTSFAEAGAFGDVHFLCVGTPQLPDGPGADLRFLESAVAALAPHLHRPCLVAGKSTVPVGTAEWLAAALAATAPAEGLVELAWNPEFLREGHAVEDSLAPDRIVVGVRSELAAKTLREVYAAHQDRGVPIVVTDLRTAELVKVVANAYLATKVSFINAMADLCEATGADVLALQDALGRDGRIGARYLHAGVGYGGGCLPKDTRALADQAARLGIHHAAELLERVDRINSERRARMVALVREECDGSLLHRKVAVLGASFKPDSDDVRDSPALAVAQLLQREGACVSVYDPAASNTARLALPSLQYVEEPGVAAAGADVVVLLTEWEEFRALDPSALEHLVARRVIVDGRNALDAERWRTAGWSYRALGRPTQRPYSSML